MAPEQLNWSPALLTGECENCAMMTPFNLENIDLGSPNLRVKDFLYGSTYPTNFVFLALTGAEIAGGGGQILPLALPGSVTLRPSPGSVVNINPSAKCHFLGVYLLNATQR